MLTQVFLVFVLLVLTSAVVWLYWRYTLVHERLEVLEQNSEGPVSLDLTPYLKLVIHDPQIIAQRESKFAKAVGALSPEYIKYRVYKQVAAELEVALNERDIDVSIQLVGLKGSKANKSASANPLGGEVKTSGKSPSSKSSSAKSFSSKGSAKKTSVSKSSAHKSASTMDNGEVDKS